MALLEAGGQRSRRRTGAGGGAAEVRPAPRLHVDLDADARLGQQVVEGVRPGGRGRSGRPRGESNAGASPAASTRRNDLKSCASSPGRRARSRRPRRRPPPPAPRPRATATRRRSADREPSRPRGRPARRPLAGSRAARASPCPASGRGAARLPSSSRRRSRLRNSKRRKYSLILARSGGACDQPLSRVEAQVALDRRELLDLAPPRVGRQRLAPLVRRRPGQVVEHALRASRTHQQVGGRLVADAGDALDVVAEGSPFSPMRSGTSSRGPTRQRVTTRSGVYTWTSVTQRGVISGSDVVRDQLERVPVGEITHGPDPRLVGMQRKACR